MDNSRILQDIASLPPEAQKQVRDFVAFLKTRYRTVPTGNKSKRGKLADEPFVGMWRDREDMQDSSDWVLKMRQSEWDRTA